MITKSLRALTLLAVLGIASCDSPLDPIPTEDPEPAFEVVDGANNGGNEDFFFLPPLARWAWPTGEFDPRRMPVVEVCELDGGACVAGDPIARFTTSEGPLDETVRAFPFETRRGVYGFYATWFRTRSYDLDPDEVYRVKVLLDGGELGHSDFRVVRSFWAWWRAYRKWRRDPSDAVIPHRMGRTMPIAFRINQGAAASPAPDPWPNEPAGLTLMTDQPWDALNSEGWFHLDRAATSRVIDDATAPYTPTSVLEHVFPAGFSGFSASAVDYYGFGLPGVKELYVGIWFKADADWEGGTSGFNVIQGVLTESGGLASLSMNGPSDGPFVLQVNGQWPGGGTWASNAGDGTITPGEWHRIELHLSYGGSPGAGVVRWWLDGTLVGNHTGVTFPADGGFTQYEIAPTAAGVTKTQDDFLRYDHTLISGN